MSVDQLTNALEKVKLQDAKKWKIGCWNIGELRLETDGENKFRKLCAFLNTKEIDICFLQETHVKSDVYKEWNKNCSNYHCYWCDGTIFKGYPIAGAAILLKNTLTVDEVKQLYPNKNNEAESIPQIISKSKSESIPESISMKTHLCAVQLKVKSKAIVLVSVYVPVIKTHFEASQPRRFTEFYNPLLQWLKGLQKNNQVILAGDFNDAESIFSWNQTREYCNVFHHLIEELHFEDVLNFRVDMYEQVYKQRPTYKYNPNGEGKPIKDEVKLQICDRMFFFKGENSFALGSFDLKDGINYAIEIRKEHLDEKFREKWEYTTIDYKKSTEYQRVPHALLLKDFLIH